MSDNTVVLIILLQKNVVKVVSVNPVHRELDEHDSARRHHHPKQVSSPGVALVEPQRDKVVHEACAEEWVGC